MPVRRVISPVLRFVRWMFSAAIPGVDLFLAVLGACWFGMMLLHPVSFDQGNFKGMQWLPDAGWMTFLGLTVTMHVAGLMRVRWVAVRVSAALLTAWFWMMVAISLTRVSIVPGCFTYALIGGGTLCAAIYISGFQRQDA